MGSVSIALVTLALGLQVAGADTFPGFGYRLLAPGDVDGDGLGDLLVVDEVGVSLADWASARHQPRAWIVSPAAGGVVFDFGARDFSSHMLRCAALGDIDSDRCADLALVNLAAPASARVELWSGRERAVSRTLTFDVTSERAIANVGDLDGDGKAELALGVCSADQPGRLSVGVVHIVRGSDGEVLRSIWGDAAGARFGERVLALGDANGDGLAELAIETSTGWRFHCPRTGVRWLWREPIRVIEPCGDVNGDGCADFIGVGLAAPTSTWCHVYSGRSGERLRAVSLAFGDYHDVQALGDVDGDGGTDFVCANYKAGFAQGQVDVVGGAGKLVWSSGPSCRWQYGWALDVLGDVDGDGKVDIAVGVDHIRSREDGVVYVLDAGSGRTIAEFHRRGDSVRVQKPPAKPAGK